MVIGGVVGGKRWGVVGRGRCYGVRWSVVGWVGCSE